METNRKKKRLSKWDQPAPEDNTQISSDKVDASVSAAAAAARINAMLEAQGKLVKPPVPTGQLSNPISSLSTPGNVAMETVPPAEIEINDSEARGTLTKGPILSDINKATGAYVSVRGRFMTPEEKAKSTADDRPLYLHIQGPNQAYINAAVQKIRTIIYEAETGTSLTTTTQGTIPAGHHYVQDKVYVGIEEPHEDFKLTNKLQGPEGSFLAHIASTTGAKVFLRGRGSGYLEPTSGRESFEALYIYISHQNADGLKSARKLCENLIEHVKQDHQVFIQSKFGHPPPPPPLPPHLGEPPQGYSPYYQNPYGPPQPQPPPQVHPHMHHLPPTHLPPGQGVAPPPNFPQIMPRGPHVPPPHISENHYYDPSPYPPGFRGPPPLPHGMIGPLPTFPPPPLVGPERPFPHGAPPPPNVGPVGAPPPPNIGASNIGPVGTPPPSNIGAPPPPNIRPGVGVPPPSNLGAPPSHYNIDTPLHQEVPPKMYIEDMSYHQLPCNNAGNVALPKRKFTEKIKETEKSDNSNPTSSYSTFSNGKYTGRNELHQVEVSRNQKTASKVAEEDDKKEKNKDFDLMPPPSLPLKGGPATTSTIGNISPSSLPTPRTGLKRPSSAQSTESKKPNSFPLVGYGDDSDSDNDS